MRLRVAGVAAILLGLVGGAISNIALGVAVICDTNCPSEAAIDAYQAIRPASAVAIALGVLLLIVAWRRSRRARLRQRTSLGQAEKDRVRSTRTSGRHRTGGWS
jgi:hypothetical protein